MGSEDSPSEARHGASKLTRWPTVLLIVAFAVGGATIACAVLWCWANSCASNPTASICKNGPPWTFISALAAAPSIVLTWILRTLHKQRDIRNVEAANRNAQAANETSKEKLRQDRMKAGEDAELALRGQLPVRFAEAAKLLGSDAVSARLGGIYALEQLAKDADEQYGRVVVETLAAFLREKRPIVASEKEEPDAIGTGLSPDIYAALVVLGRRSTETAMKTAPNLSRSDFCGLEMATARLRGFILGDVDMHAAKLMNADLRGAYLRHSDLSSAHLFQADLTGANLIGANLYRATFSFAKLASVDILEADLREASLEGVDLQQAVGLSVEQVLLARYWYLSKLPNNIAAKAWASATDRSARWAEGRKASGWRGEHFNWLRRTLPANLVRDLDGEPGSETREETAAEIDTAP